MAFISAKDIPLYFGNNVNSNTAPTEGDAGNRGVIATQVQLNYTPNIGVTRVVGKEPSKDSFNLVGPPNASLSFSAYVGATAEFDITDYTGEQSIGTSFAIGDIANGIKGSGAHLTSYSLTVTPYAPVLIQCDFAIYNPLTTTSEGGFIADAGADGLLDALSFGDYGHGVYSSFGKTSDETATFLDDIDVVESVTYQYSAQRLPIYKIGAYNIQTAEGGAKLISAEHSFQIQGDNIQKLVPITGSNPGSMSLKVKKADSSTLLSVEVDGRINAENVTVTAGDVARGSVSITEPLV